MKCVDVFFEKKSFKIISNYDQLKPIKHVIIKIHRVGYIRCHNTFTAILYYYYYYDMCTYFSGYQLYQIEYCT